MKIAVFSRSTIHHFTTGGMEAHLKNLLDGLGALGHDITVFTTSYPTDDPQHKIVRKDIEEEQGNIKYIFLGDTTSGLNPLTIWEKLFMSIGLLSRNNLIEGNKNYHKCSSEAFFRMHIKNSFDCILSQSTAAKGLLEHEQLRTPIISVIHGTIPNEVKSRFNSNKTLKNWVRFILVDYPRWMFEHHIPNREFFRRCKYIIAVSNDLRKKFLMDYPKLKHRVRVVYNGVDDVLFSPGSADTKYRDFTALYVGRVDREKGIDLLLNAINIARKNGASVKAKIIGMGIHIYEFKNLTKALGLLDSVEFLGQIPNKDLVTYYQKSHIFVLPTRREEGHPVTISEAMCCGLPVVATKKGGLAELITDSKDGFYIDTGSASSLAYILKHLYEKKDLLKEMSVEARKTGEMKFSKRAMIQGYNSILEKI